MAGADMPSASRASLHSVSMLTWCVRHLLVRGREFPCDGGRLTDELRWSRCGHRRQLMPSRSRSGLPLRRSNSTPIG